MLSKLPLTIVSLLSFQSILLTPGYSFTSAANISFLYLKVLMLTNFATLSDERMLRSKILVLLNMGKRTWYFKLLKNRKFEDSWKIPRN